MDQRTKKFFDVVCPAVEDLTIELELHWASSTPINDIIKNGIPSFICSNKNNNLKFMARPGSLT